MAGTWQAIVNVFAGVRCNEGFLRFKPYLPEIWKSYTFKLPKKKQLLDIHRICFDIHLELLEKYDFATDIVFTRPNYCKIHLMVYNQRGENLFQQFLKEQN